MRVRSTREIHFNILGIIVLFLIALFVSIVLQMAISRYQSKNIMTPITQRTGNIQSISTYLNDVDSCMEVLAGYRWDYSDSAVIITTIRQYIKEGSEAKKQFSRDIQNVGQDQYLMINAITTTATQLESFLQQFIDLLLDGKKIQAADLYYDKIETCGSYLKKYTQQLLELAILDYHDTYTYLIAQNERLKIIQTIINVFCVVSGVLLAIFLFRLLSLLREMSKESQSISQGNFDVPDIDYHRKDEMGAMTTAFNAMKHSMKQQVSLLEEKNDMARKLFKKENETLGLQNLLEKEKLQQLRSQINPHFLFNTLNAIKITAQAEGAVKTDALLASLGRLYRYVLASNDSEVPLSREIMIAEQFYSLYHVRFGEKIKLVVHCSPDLELTETMVPSFILQPLVGNAIRHGLGPKEENGTIVLSIWQEGPLLKASVEDDGVGMSKETLEEVRANLQNPSGTGEHIGLYNVAARLKLWGSRSGLSVDSTQGKGTTVNLWLPLVVRREDEEDLDR